MVKSWKGLNILICHFDYFREKCEQDDFFALNIYIYLYIIYTNMLLLCINDEIRSFLFENATTELTSTSRLCGNLEFCVGFFLRGLLHQVHGDLADIPFGIVTAGRRVCIASPRARPGRFFPDRHLIGHLESLSQGQDYLRCHILKITSNKEKHFTQLSYSFEFKGEIYYYRLIQLGFLSSYS